MQQLQHSIQEWQDLGDTLITSGDWNDDTAAAQWKCFWTNLGLYEPEKREEEDQKLPTIEVPYKWTIYTYCHCYNNLNLKYSLLLKGCVVLIIKP